MREYAGDTVDITVIDRNPYLLFIPNIPGEVFENRDPAHSLKMDTYVAWSEIDAYFIQGAVKTIDPGSRRVTYLPSERDGSASESLTYDYLVVTRGCRLAYDAIEGFADYGQTVSDT